MQPYLKATTRTLADRSEPDRIRSSAIRVRAPKGCSQRETNVKLTDEDKAAVTQALTDYYKAFSTLDAQAVAP